MPVQTISPGIIRMRPHPHLYEINTWSWLERLSARAKRTVKLDDVSNAEWDALAELGFDVIWLMGIWQRSPESRRVNLENDTNFPAYDAALPGWKPADVIGSPYAVAQYVPDPRIGTWETLDRTREKLHARGMALFLDFVGNHTALDHPWTRARPNFYVQGSQEDFEKNPALFYPVDTIKGTRFLARAKDPYFPPWKDVAQLNHFEPAMRATQIADLRNIAKHCDGLRCDMAMLQLNDIFEKGWSHLLNGAPPPAKEFWTEARAAAPNLILLAEAYWGTEAKLIDLGFSFAYDKALYDAVRNADVGAVQTRLSANPKLQSHFARFLENHDEQRRAAVIGNDRLPAVGTLMATLPGMRFYQQGELEGCKIHLPITLRIAVEEPPDLFASAFFQKILHIAHEEVFHSAEWNTIDVRPEGYTSPAGLLVYEWRSAKAWKIVAVNLAAGASQGRVPLGNRVSPAQQYIFYDELNDVRYDRDGKELHDTGLFIRLEGFQAHIFHITPA